MSNIKRGSELKQSKLNESDIKIILMAVSERERLRAEASQLSNKSLAKKFDVHYRTIEKIVSGATWRHVIN